MGIGFSKREKVKYSKKDLTEKAEDKESRREHLVPENIDAKSFGESSMELQDRGEAVLDTTDKPLQSSTAEEERGGYETNDSLSDRFLRGNSVHLDSPSCEESCLKFPERSKAVSSTTEKPHFDSPSLKTSSWEYTDGSEVVTSTTEKTHFDSPSGEGSSLECLGRCEVIPGTLPNLQFDFSSREESSSEYPDRTEDVSGTTDKPHFDSRSLKKRSWEYPDGSEVLLDTTDKLQFDFPSREGSSLEYPDRSEGLLGTTPRTHFYSPFRDERSLKFSDRSEVVSGTTDKSLQSPTAECFRQPNGNGTNKSLSEKFLRRIAAQIGKEWYSISLSLGVTNAEIDHIEYDRGYDAQTKIVKALLKWRSKSSHLSAHSQLEQLLTELQENGRKDLAEKYREYLEKPLLTQVSVENESEIEEDVKIRTLREQLFIFNEKETQRVPVSPLQKSATLSIDEIYAPLYIKEDLEYKEKGRNIGRAFKSQKKSKLVKRLDDIFYINKEKGEMVENVFMLGDAGHGKTVFCQQLLKKWCRAREKVEASTNVHQLDKWEELLLQFDYLFHVQLRHVDKRRTSLIDMICYDVFACHPGCHMTIRQVVSNGIQKCLVVVDGLDEWKLSKKEKCKLKFEGLPNLDGMGNSTVFWTSRPWKFDDIIETLRSRDRVLEIHGLEEKGIEVITDKVLANFYELDMDSIDSELLKNDLLKKIGDGQLKDLMKIPLIAIAGIQIWTEKKRFANSMTTFFIALTDMLIGRALKKKDISEKASGMDEKSSNKRINILKRFEESDYAVDYLPLLEKLGEIAYNDLISNEKNLVFKKRYLERNLGKYTVEFALKVGLLSQCEAPGCFSEENISINFFHKSMQEFLAAIHVASGKVSGDSFCSSLTDFQVIFELGNIVMFLSGLDPSIGTLISQHIAGLADSDKDVTEYRQNFIRQDWIKSDDNKIRLLYKLQLSCFREIRFAQTILKSEEVAIVKPVITDVFVDKNSEKDTIQNILDIFVSYSSTIKSLTIENVSNHFENEITDQVLSNFLDKAVSLQSLYVYGSGTYSYLHKMETLFYSLTSLMLFDVTVTWDVLFTLPTILSSNKMMKYFGVYGIKIMDNKKMNEEGELAPLSGLIQILPSIQQLTSLTIGVYSKEEKRFLIDVLRELSCLEIFRYVGYPEHESDDSDDDVHDNDLHDGDDCDALIVCAAATECAKLKILICFSIHMDRIPLPSNVCKSKIEVIFFHTTRMSEEGWMEFIQSLTNFQGDVKVLLHETDITVESQMMIRSLPQFKITRNEIDEDGETVLEFTKLTSAGV